MSDHRNLGSVTISLTSGCNLSCSYCFQNAKTGARMEWETVRASVDLALATTQDEVELIFFGGEPLIRFDTLRRAVDYALANRPPGTRVRFGLITNGTLLRTEVLAFLDEHRVDTQISMDGIPEAQRLRGEGTFAKLDAALDRLRRDHPRFFAEDVTVSLTVVPETVRYLADSVRYLLEKGVESLALSPTFTGSAGWQVEDIHDLDREFEAIYRATFDHYARTDRVPILSFRHEDGPKPRPVKRSMCGVGRGDTPVVDVDGSVHGCATFTASNQRFPSAFLRDRLEPLALGSLSDPEFASRYAAFGDAVRGAEIFDDKQSKYSSYGSCGTCPHLADCGICPVSIGHIPGNEDPHRVPDFLCAFNLIALKYRAAFPGSRDPGELLTGRPTDLRSLGPLRAVLMRSRTPGGHHAPPTTSR